MDILGIFIALFGIYLLTAAGFDWDWFMVTRQARAITLLTGGRARTRVVFLILGGFFLLMGVLGTFGIINLR